MATLENIPGLKAEVFVDNKPLEEFDDDEDEPEVSGDVSEYRAFRSLCKYVESNSD